MVGAECPYHFQHFLSLLSLTGTMRTNAYFYALPEINLSLFVLGLVSCTQTFSHRHMMSIKNGKKVDKQAKDISANRWLLGFFLKQTYTENQAKSMISYKNENETQEKKKIPKKKSIQNVLPVIPVSACESAVAWPAFT